MASDVKGRPYDSPRRRAQAAETRRAILDAARRLFEEGGYASTPVPSIAAEANVALKTVYLAFETKAGLLRAVWDARLGGEEEAMPVLDRSWFREVTAEADPARKLRLVAAQSRRVKTSSGRLLEVIRTAGGRGDRRYVDAQPPDGMAFTRARTKLVPQALQNMPLRRLLPPPASPASRDTDDAD